MSAAGQEVQLQIVALDCSPEVTAAQVGCYLQQISNADTAIKSVLLWTSAAKAPDHVGIQGMGVHPAGHLITAKQGWQCS